MLACSAPLLDEKNGHSEPDIDRECSRSIFVEPGEPGPALTPGDHPVDNIKVDFAEIFQQPVRPTRRQLRDSLAEALRFRGRPCFRFSTLTPHQTCLKLAIGVQARLEATQPSVMPLGKDLVGYDDSLPDITSRDLFDEVVRNSAMEEIAHRVHEDLPPAASIGEARPASLGRAANRSLVHTDGRHPTKPLGKDLRISIEAARRDSGYSTASGSNSHPSIRIFVI